MKLYDMLGMLGDDKVIQPFTESTQLEDGNFEFSKYSGDKNHQSRYNEYSSNPASVVPNSLIDVIKVKNEGLLGQNSKGGQSGFAGLNGTIKRYIKKMGSLTKGNGDLGWDGGRFVSKDMINKLQAVVIDSMKKNEYLNPFDWSGLISDYTEIISKHVRADDIGALPTSARAKLPTGEEGVTLAEYLAQGIVTDIIAKQFAMRRPLNTEEEVEKYKNRVEKLGFLGQVEDTGGFSGMLDRDTPPVDTAHARPFDPTNP